MTPSPHTPHPSLPWWKQAIVYQIYPRSFQDTNADGVGDLPGILQRLDYLHELGVTAIWISPIYPSPMADFGYDVSNYKDIHPLFGSLADLDRLVQEAHAHDLKVILDYVPNHTSNLHPWFLESRASRHNPKRDWYVWRDPAPDGGPPNNWLAHFGGESAWEWDKTTGQYYLHLFLAEQPDLNWRNPEVQKEMLDVLRFWLERGVDGFRVDVSFMTIKDPELRDNPPNPAWQPGMDPYLRLLPVYSQNTPDNHDFNRWLRKVVDEYDDRLLIGEIYLPILELVTHYGRQDEFHLPFNFHLILTEWTPAAIRDLVEAYEAALPEGDWPNWVLGNHDKHRFATRAGAEQARLGMLLLLTLRGTPTLYYGDELGMQDGEIPPDRVQDPAEINAPGLGLGHDPERTPMQWDPSPQAGFCPADVEPWLPVTAGYETLNVQSQAEDPRSMLAFTRRLIALRQASPALLHGRYRTLQADENLLVYERQTEGERLVILLNFSSEPRTWTLPAGVQGQVILSTFLEDGEPVTDGKMSLRGHQGLVLR